MSASIDEARAAANAILERFDSAGINWRIFSVEIAQSPTSEAADLVIPIRYSGPSPFTIQNVDKGPEAFAVSFGDALPDGVTVTAHYPLVVPQTEAIVELASQMQDLVTEFLSWGTPIPPCPEHNHPMRPLVWNGNAVWQCPKDAGHHTEPIFHAFRGPSERDGRPTKP